MGGQVEETASALSAVLDAAKRHGSLIFAAASIACLSLCFLPVGFVAELSARERIVLLAVGVLAGVMAVGIPVERALRRAVAKRQAERKLVESLRNLPDVSKEILKEVMDEGEVYGNIRDPKFRYLYSVGVLVGPPQFEIFGGDLFSVDPIALKLLKDNEKEIFGENDQPS